MVPAGSHTGGGSLDPYVRQWLGPLIAYDDEHATDLVLTLSVYLQSAGAFPVAAGRLRVHASTVRYRIHLVRLLTGLDLRERAVQSHLSAALGIWDSADGSR